MQGKLIDGKFYEVVSKPWFGPRKRAKEFLTDRSRLQSPEEAYQTLREILGNRTDGIQGIRFYDFVDNNDGFHYTIGLIWTFCDPVFRDKIYSIASDWVKASGWYPLPQGERIGSHQIIESFFNRHKWEAKLPQFSGQIESLCSTVDHRGGCSVAVKIGSEYLILDTGLSGSYIPQKLDKLCFVTHTHGDHTGNIDLVNKNKIPVIMSETTSYLLSKFKIIRDSDLSQNTIPIASNEKMVLGDSLELQAFPVPHMPGALGAIIKDKIKALVFTGDICFRTARHDYIDEFVEIVKNIDVKDKYVMIDATMAGRSFGATATETAAQICARDDVRDIVFSAPSADHLLYAYLDIFHHVKEGATRNSVHFCLGSRLRAMFECIHESFITRRQDVLDPFLLAQYHKTMSAWAESRWVLWLPATPQIKPDQKRYYFVSDADMKYLKLPKDAWYVRIGREGEFDSPKKLNVDANAWSLHSDEDSLVEATRKLSSISKVILFHNSKDKLNSFMKTHNLRASILSQSPYSL